MVLYNFQIQWAKYSFAAVQVWFDPPNYNVTEGDVINITLVTSTSDYEFDFNVTLQHINGPASGESSLQNSSEYE